MDQNVINKVSSNDKQCGELQSALGWLMQGVNQHIQLSSRHAQQ